MVDAVNGRCAGECVLFDVLKSWVQNLQGARNHCRRSHCAKSADIRTMERRKKVPSRSLMQLLQFFSLPPHKIVCVCSALLPRSTHCRPVRHGAAATKKHPTHRTYSTPDGMALGHFN